MTAKSWRRALGLAGMAAVSFCTAVEGSPALGPEARFRAIKIDVRPIAEAVGEPTATWVAEALPGPLQAAFAGRIAPGDRSAPTLVVRIDMVFLGQSGPGGRDSQAVIARDEVQGAGVVVVANGRTLGAYPLLTVQDDFTGGVNYEMGSEQRRVSELAQSFAHWLPGQMGL